MKKLSILNTLWVVIFCLSINIYAQEMTKSETIYNNLLKKDIQYFGGLGDYVDSEQNWKVLAYVNKDKSFLAIFEENKLLYEYSHSFASDSFVKGELFVSHDHASLIATTWKRGVHGEQFILLDPSNQKKVYNANSSWPIEFSICAKGIAIGIANGTDKNGQEIFEIHYWQDKTPVKIISIDEPSDHLCKQVKRLNVLKNSKEFKKMQRERILKTKPWLKMKGAITPEGKAKSKMNALKTSPELYSLIAGYKKLMAQQKEIQNSISHIEL